MRLLLLVALLLSAEATVNFFKNDTKWEFDDQAAEFGPVVPDKGLKGWLVAAAPDEFACEPLQLDNNTKQAFVVLVSRGPEDDPCTFVEKVLRSQEAGAKAVIVYNYDDDLVIMQGYNTSDVQIPAVMVSKSSAEIMLEALANASPYDKIVVTLEPNKDDWEYEDEVGYALVFIMSTSLFMCVACFGFYVYNSSRRTRSDEDFYPYRWKQTTTMGLEEVMNLPEIVLQASSPQIGESCSICLGDFVVGESVRLLPCSHIFHNSCIIPWLTERNAICPLCKHDLQGAPIDPDFSYRAFTSDTILDEYEASASSPVAAAAPRSQPDLNCPV